ncbi:MAG: 50S ribosomal protein L22 [candidate division Zixibacteria bacterium]|nr:50S ribosomal protein L22 [candidate division Zixibacteria bacterium]
MQAHARVRYLRMSPRKMRRVADLIKGKPVQEALNILNFTPKLAAHHLAKTVKAAAANAISGVGTAKLKAEDLAITRVTVDEAPTAKRVRFQSMGRVFRLRKRYCHVMVQVEGEPEPEAKGSAAKRKKAKAEKAAPDAKATRESVKREESEDKEKTADTAAESSDTAAEADDIKSEENKNEA